MNLRRRIRPQPHTPTAACMRDHCYSHGIDEPITGRQYTVCGECYHVFPTRFHLWADHVREVAGMHWRELSRPRIDDPGIIAVWADPDAFRTPRRTIALHLILLPFTRPSRIVPCPHCIHDL